MNIRKRNNMLYDYLKLAYRNIKKHKSFALINIIGLSIGIASFILIMMYVGYELSYDKFYKESDNIYRVYMKYKEGNSFVPADAQTYYQTGQVIAEKFPEVKDFVRLYQIGEAAMIDGDNIVEESKGFFADSNFFNVFNLEFKLGSKKTALEAINSIVLTESLARKIFGNDRVLGKDIYCFANGKKRNLKITGIISDLPKNTSIKFNYLVSFPTGKNWMGEKWEPNWDSNGFFTYLLLHERANVTDLSNKLESAKFQWDEERFAIEPLTDIHLHSDKPYEMEANGSSKRIYFLLVISIAIIILSWLNYINLSLSKIKDRAKDASIRKAIGANKKQLMVQFIIDALLINLIAIIIASALLAYALPLMSKLIGVDFSLRFVVGKYVLFFVVILLGALLSGVSPALVLSNIKPALALKATNNISKGSPVLQKLLVVVQFSITTVLIANSILVTKQLNYMQTRPLGVSINDVLCVKGDVYNESDEVEQELLVFKEELQKMSFIESVSSTETYPGDGYTSLNYNVGLNLPNGKHNDDLACYFYYIDENYASLLDIEFISGGNFSKLERKGILINETACKKLELKANEELIGKQIGIWGEQYQIKGVIKDYYHFGLNKEQIPLLLFNKELAGQNFLINFKNKEKSISSLRDYVALIKSKWDSMFPESSFNYSFVDEDFNNQYASEQQFRTAFSIFTIIALVIACLGLLGTTSYTVAKRTKEIGIRKVNGAKGNEILAMLNTNVILWVGLSFIVAIPFSWYVMQKWLENFALKTDISWWIFIIAGGSTLFVAISTVSWQTWKASKRNPVEALRYE